MSFTLQQHVAGVLLFAATLLVSNPDRDPPAPQAALEAKKMLPPVIAGYCQFGRITQDGRWIAIEGETWSAHGYIRPDLKSLYLVWEKKGTEQIAAGVYQMDERELKGHWGWGDETQITPDGPIFGKINEETLHLRERE